MRIELRAGEQGSECTMEVTGSQRSYTHSTQLHIQPLAIDVGQQQALVHHTHTLVHRTLKRLRADQCEHPLSEV